ncbi:MAG: DUF4416 family protein [Candidatus Eremiobacteraeota bacterium]|nr:DUF4416 family protein [Candidatus Eremiobacteraeota bacterium]
MAGITSVPPVKLFAGVLYRDEAFFSHARQALEEAFGPADYVGSPLAFDPTDYYEEEMGRGLMRRFLSFERLMDPGSLASVKLHTNSIEDTLSDRGRRAVNIDPGYLDYRKVVLASAKYGPHKIYVGQGIYADLTLIYGKGRFSPLEWSFPDFRDGRYDGILMEIRTLFKKKFPGGSRGPGS